MARFGRERVSRAPHDTLDRRLTRVAEALDVNLAYEELVDALGVVEVLVGSPRETQRNLVHPCTTIAEGKKDPGERGLARWELAGGNRDRANRAVVQHGLLAVSNAVSNVGLRFRGDPLQRLLE